MRVPAGRGTRRRSPGAVGCSSAVISSARRCIGAGREQVRRVALDELADLAGPERIAMHVEPTVPAPSSKGWLWHRAAAGVRTGLARRRVVRHSVAPRKIGARNAREALPPTDVRADAVEGVERGLEELVADLERFREFLVRRERIQLGLFDVLSGRVVNVGDVGEVCDDRPRRNAGEENAGGQEERTSEPTEKGNRPTIW